MDPPGLRCARGGRGDHRPRRPGHRGPRRADRAQPRLVDHRQRGRHPDQARAGHHRRGARAAAYGGRPRRPRHPDLHLGHHRPAQGLHAHPRQLHGRARRGRRRAARALRARGRLDAALPAAGARVRADHPDRRRQVTVPARAQRRHQEPRRRPAGVPADVRARRAAGLREGVQHRLPAGHRRRPRRDLRPGRRGRHRLLARPRPGQAVDRRPRPARGVLPARLRQAPRGARRPLRVRRLRRGAARRPARPLLPRHRRHRPRGLRPDRDHRRPHRQPARRGQDRHGRTAHPGHRRTRGRGRRAAVQGRPGLHRLLAQRRRDRRGARAPTAGSTPATSARSTTRASSGSPAARRRSW